MNHQLALITCSYAPDFLRCQRLCQSVDRWVSSDIAHHVVVPARDLPVFSTLKNERRTVIAVEDVVPGAVWQLPFTQRWWLDAHAWPIRGWIMQQVTKLSANHVTDAEYLLFADSDIQFVRPFGRDQVLRENRLRLHRMPGAMNTGEHLRWHHQAARLLGLTPRYFGADYIGQLITWRRSQLIALQAHLEQTQGRPWHESIGHSLRVSEYILYGAFIDSTGGATRNGHYADSKDLCHCCWFLDEAQALGTGSSTLQPDAVAVLLQSNLGLSHTDEQRILERIAPQRIATMEIFSS